MEIDNRDEIIRTQLDVIGTLINNNLRSMAGDLWGDKPPLDAPADKEAPKAGKYDIILTGENVRTLLEFYEQRSASAMIYPQYSDWKAGEAVQGDVTDGEKLNIALMPTRPFSDEGIPMWPRPLMEEGTLLTIHGGARFASYLEIEPTGEYEKLALDCGTKPLADLRRPGTLEAVSFSDFQMDPMDGHFGGELRLGLLRGEHGKMTALSGGSINGRCPSAPVSRLRCRILPVLPPV